MNASKQKKKLIKNHLSKKKETQQKFSMKTNLTNRNLKQVSKIKKGKKQQIVGEESMNVSNHKK